MKRTVRRTKASGTSQTTDHHSAKIWAVISICTFLITYVYAAGIVSPLAAFGLGCAAMILMLAVEGLLRGKLWMFEPRYKTTFDDPNMPVRLLIFVGSIILILETAFLVGVVIPNATRAFQVCGT